MNAIARRPTNAVAWSTATDARMDALSCRGAHSRIRVHDDNSYSGRSQKFQSERRCRARRRGGRLASEVEPAVVKGRSETDPSRPVLSERALAFQQNAPD